MKNTVDYRTQSYAFISDNKSRSNADCQASFCPDPNGIQMIVVGILIALLIAVTGGMIVAIYLIASTMLVGLSWVGLITGGIFTFLQLPLEFHTVGFFGLIMLFVVGGIKWMLGCG